METSLTTKPIMKNATKLSSFLLGAAILMASCSKKNDDPVTTPQRWMKSYSNIILGDDENSTQGQFFNTRTGQVVKLQDAAPVRNQLSLIYSVTYGGNAYLAAPANLDEDDPYDNDEGPIYNAPGAGINFWTASEKNSMEISLCNMTGAEFDQLAGTATWQAFDNAFRKNNSGEADLSFTSNSILDPDAGAVYLIQLNGSIRCIARIITTSPDQSAGYLKFNMVVEGRDDMSAAGKALMPAQ